MSSPASPATAGTEQANRDPLSIPGDVKSSIRILVVDDERTLRESCASVLEMDGFNLTVIGRGEEALEAVKRRKFDIMLVDLYMSQVSGIDLLRAALQLTLDPPRRAGGTIGIPVAAEYVGAGHRVRQRGFGQLFHGRVVDDLVALDDSAVTV